MSATLTRSRLLPNLIRNQVLVRRTMALTEQEMKDQNIPLGYLKIKKLQAELQADKREVFRRGKWWPVKKVVMGVLLTATIVETVRFGYKCAMS